MIWLVDRLARLVGGRRVQVDTPLPAGVQVRESRLVTMAGGYLSGMKARAAAVALGRTILVHPAVQPNGRLLRHELAHVSQWARHPYTFPIRYIRAHLRHGYNRNPFEVEARAAERRSATGEDL